MLALCRDHIRMEKLQSLAGYNLLQGELAQMSTSLYVIDSYLFINTHLI